MTFEILMKDIFLNSFLKLYEMDIEPFCSNRPVARVKFRGGELQTREGKIFSVNLTFFSFF